MNGKKLIIAGISLTVAAFVAVTTITRCDHNKPVESETTPVVEKLLFGIPEDDFNVSSGTIESGVTLSTLLNNYGISPVQIDLLDRKSKAVFDLRKIKTGNDYTVFLTPDSMERLKHFVYEIDVTKYVVFSFIGDSVEIKLEEKEVFTRRRADSAQIESSLWNAMAGNNISTKLAIELSEIFAWSVDFFALQKGDKFKIIYDENFIDSTAIGTGRIWGAWFEHGGKRYYAIPFEQHDRITFWDENGNSLRKNLLKAPLKFSRVSSKFSNSRLHPVLRIRRPHHGVDYAAPSGTPVFAVADGVVTIRAYKGGGGNTIKLKHSQNLMSGYLHLKGFAKGLKVGSRVKQGDIIGYVGTTGLSTGAHLDFRIWRNSVAIDPLKIPSTPSEPIAKQDVEKFNKAKQRVMSALFDKLSIDSLDMNTIMLRPQADSSMLLINNANKPK